MEKNKEKIREAFLKVFCGCDEGSIVLDELARFCMDSGEDFIPDPRIETFFCGRRSVLQHIRNIIREEI